MKKNEYYKSLFLSQSYQDNWNTYTACLENDTIPVWDAVYIVSEDERYLRYCGACIAKRKAQHFLPDRTSFHTVPGEGFSLSFLKNKPALQGKRILVLFDDCPKKSPLDFFAAGLFSSVPHKAQDGRLFSLFDETLVCMTNVAKQITGGIVTVRGSRFVMFNCLQIHSTFSGRVRLKGKQDGGETDTGIELYDTELSERILGGAEPEHVSAALFIDPCTVIDFESTEKRLAFFKEEAEHYACWNWSRATCINSLIDKNAVIGQDCFIENARIGEHVTVGNGCVLYACALEHETVPDGTVLCGADRFDFALLPDSFDRLNHEICCSVLVDMIRERTDFAAIQKKLGTVIFQREFAEMVMARAKSEDFSTEIRIYNFLAHTVQDGEFCRMRCFETIKERMLVCNAKHLEVREKRTVCNPSVNIRLPLRVNWGGTWSDTPPYCLENGGTVLNAAVKINGQFPVEVTLEAIPEKKIVFKCTDDKAEREIRDIREIYDCANASDVFSLHKAALIASGVVPLHPGPELDEILDNLGAGLCLSTGVVGIPRGSGLGTSSILAGGCVRAFAAFFGEHPAENDVFNKVLCIEQLMNTGGGWQDQVGGLVPGIKLVSSQKGMYQDIRYETVQMKPEALKELENRLCLVFSGQRRLARNLLREVVEAYLSGKETSVQLLPAMIETAGQMKASLENGDIDAFASHMNAYWALAMKMYPGHTNRWIEEIFASCADMTAGKMVCGASGGGFLQILLKKPYTKTDLQQRLNTAFPDGEVSVYDSSFVV